MDAREFGDAALVLFGHGTSLNAYSSVPVYQHAAELRRRNCFAEVREAFWNQEPHLDNVLPEVRTARVFLAPLFISEGYFSEVVIPRHLGFRGDREVLRVTDPRSGFRGQASGDFPRVQRRGAQTLVYCKPIGTHERMTDVLLARASEVVEKFPFPRPPEPKDITLLIAGHGTEKDEHSRQAMERQVELIRVQGIYGGVNAIFLEEEPRIGSWHELAQTRNVVIVPFFISDGMHTQEDLPVLLGEPKRVIQQRLQSGQPAWRNPTEKKGKLVWYTSSVGTDPRMADVVLERVREAAQWK